jgi:hypothetical protein
MASGSVPLLTAVSIDDGNMLARGVIDTIIQESPIVEQLPWVSIVGESYVTREEDERTAIAFRKVNATYSTTYGTERKTYWGIAICGGEVKVDNFIVNTRGDVVGAKVHQYAKVAKNAARWFDKQVIDANGTSDAFKGVNTLISEGHGQTKVVATDGATLVTAGMAVLDEAIDLLRRGRPDAAWLNLTTRRQITELGRNFSSGYSLIDVGNDAFGRQVMSYAGIPLRIIGDDEAGAQILAFDETTGTSSVTASMYFVKFGEDNVHGLLGGGGTFEVKDFGEQQAAPVHMGRIEFYPGICIPDPYSVVRVSGILAS